MGESAGFITAVFYKRFAPSSSFRCSRINDGKERQRTREKCGSGKGSEVISGERHAQCEYLEVKYLYATLQSHSPWKGFKIWTLRVLLPRKNR